MQSERSGKQYKHLSAEERAVRMVMLDARQSLRAIAARLGRAPSTLSRELARTLSMGERYDAGVGGARAARLRRQPRSLPKLGLGAVLFGVVEHWLRAGWSTEQIAGRLKAQHAEDLTRRASHETTYTALHGLPLTRDVDRRWQTFDLLEIHVRPPEVEDRMIPGHWEGDLIKGTANRSSIGTVASAAAGWCCWCRCTTPPLRPRWRASRRRSTACPHRCARA